MTWQSVLLLVLGVLASGFNTYVGGPAWFSIVGIALGQLAAFLSGVFHPTTSVGVVNNQGQPVNAGTIPAK